MFSKSFTVLEAAYYYGWLNKCNILKSNSLYFLSKTTRNMCCAEGKKRHHWIKFTWDFQMCLGKVFIGLEHFPFHHITTTIYTNGIFFVIDQFVTSQCRWHSKHVERGEGSVMMWGCIGTRKLGEVDGKMGGGKSRTSSRGCKTLQIWAGQQP